MLREQILKEFPKWSSEKQLAEFQGYKSLGSFSPFTEDDYLIMEAVMNNQNVSVDCENGVCTIKDVENEEDFVEINYKELLETILKEIENSTDTILIENIEKIINERLN